MRQAKGLLAACYSKLLSFEIISTTDCSLLVLDTNHLVWCGAEILHTRNAVALQKWPISKSVPGPEA